MKPVKVFVGLSGGVDSSVSALLLKQQGYEVHGLFMKNWEEDDNASFCSAQTDLADVRAICNKLDIPLHSINFSQEYWEQVFSYFLDEYKAGRTPNPDILCNKEIKFKAFLDHAMKLGADYIATGHYVQSSTISPNSTDGLRRTSPYQLLRGFDANKDQSYFLYTLNQYALSKSLFPIGHLEKPLVREMARNAELRTHDKKDSTGICFIGERKFKSFLQDFMRDKPGDMLTPEGKYIAKHDGLMYYTLGQRQGLKIGGVKGFAEKPWYVLAKDIDNNKLYVTQDESHPWHNTLIAKANSLNWINPPASTTFHCTAKVRYRQLDQACEVTLKNDAAIIRFETPQRAVTPGQSIVFYRENVCLGGGQLQGTDSMGGIIQTRIQVSDWELA